MAYIPIFEESTKYFIDSDGKWADYISEKCLENFCRYPRYDMPFVLLREPHRDHHFATAHN